MSASGTARLAPGILVRSVGDDEEASGAARDSRRPSVPTSTLRETDRTASTGETIVAYSRFDPCRPEQRLASDGSSPRRPRPAHSFVANQPPTADNDPAPRSAARFGPGRRRACAPGADPRRGGGRVDVGRRHELFLGERLLAVEGRGSACREEALGRGPMFVLALRERRLRALPTSDFDCATTELHPPRGRPFAPRDRGVRVLAICVSRRRVSRSAIVEDRSDLGLLECASGSRAALASQVKNLRRARQRGVDGCLAQRFGPVRAFVCSARWRFEGTCHLPPPTITRPKGLAIRCAPQSANMAFWPQRRPNVRRADASPSVLKVRPLKPIVSGVGFQCVCPFWVEVTIAAGRECPSTNCEGRSCRPRQPFSLNAASRTAPTRWFSRRSHEGQMPVTPPKPSH